MRAIVFLLLFISVLHARIVIDKKSGEPVSQVIILCGNVATYSDDEGRFELPENVCDTIQFSHIGYNSLFLAREQAIALDTIKLEPKTITTDDVIVTDNLTNTLSLSKTTNKILSEEEKDFYTNLSEVINKNSTLIIKDYGGYAGLKTASVRGMSSENTIVLFNEAKVNDIRTGTFDLSLVSPSVLSSVSYSGFSTDSYYGASAGGVLKLSTLENLSEKKLGLSGGFTSFNGEKYSAIYKNYSGNVNYSVNAERSYGKNDYEYNFREKSLRRSNSFYSRSFISGNINYNLSANSLTLYSHYSTMTNGLPGFVTANNYNSSKAVNHNKSLLIVLNDHYLVSENLVLSSNLSTHFQKIRYEDPENKIVSVGNIQSSRLTDIGYNVNGNYNPGGLTTFTFGVRGSLSKLTGLSAFTSAKQPPSTVSKNENIIFGGVSIFREINPDFLNYIKASLLLAATSVNEEIYIKKSDNSFAFNAGVEANLPLPLKPSIVFHYSRDTRIPTFNERYYSGLYDISALQNEKYDVLDIGIEIQNNKSGKTYLSVYYFTVDAKNKIVWTPYLSTLQVPRNLNEAKNSGFEITLNQEFSKYNTDFNVIYTYTDAKNISRFENDNTDGKQLIYTPKHNLKSGINYSPGNFNFNLSVIYTGSRYFTYDNDPYSKLDPFFITDFSVSALFNVFDTGHRFSLSIFNLFNRDYMVIQSYPMPKRTFNLNYTLELL